MAQAPKIDLDALSALHAQVAEVLKAALSEKSVDAKVVQLAIQFLKDNGVTAVFVAAPSASPGIPAGTSKRERALRLLGNTARNFDEAEG